MRRFLFDIWLPCRDPRLVFQVWDHNLLEASDSIAEVALDLSKDFRSARTLSWPCTSPSMSDGLE
eukprot:2499384-Amphidinium_carterae.1